MNQRPAAKPSFKTFADLASRWPEVSSLGEHRGKVHTVRRHKHWCPTLHGGGVLSCRCSPIITYHVEPTIQ